MGARGRSSVASLVSVNLEAHDRPNPPDDLDEEAAAEWRKVVSRLPSDWFAPENEAMLAARCQQVVWLRQTAKLIDEVQNSKKKLDFREYNGLIRQAVMQTRTILQLDTAMRLTQQSTYDKSKRKGAARNKKTPWQDAIADTE